MSCDNKDKINTLFSNLTGDYTSIFPNIDWNDDLYNLTSDTINDIRTRIPKIDITDVTTGVVNGSGAFDQFMKSAAAHLREEYDKNRITGSDYTKAWISLMDSSLAQAVAFTIQKDDAYWRAVTAQLAAITALINMEVAKAQAAALQAETSNKKAEYGLTKAKIVTEELTQCQLSYTTETMMPAQKSQVDAQTAQVSYTTANMLPKQVDKLDKEIEHIGSQIVMTDYQISDVLPAQVALVNEQMESQRANTSDTRSDGTTPIVGSIGKQKDLYSQQITSYQRDAEVKAASIWKDIYTTQFAITEAEPFPTMTTNTVVNDVLSSIKTKNGL